MRRLPYLLVLLAFGLAAPAPAQRAPAEPPVRYDADLPDAAFHRSRREAVKEALPENAVAVFFSAPVRNRQGDVDFEYRQSSDLLYLTGSHEPETILVLAPGGLSVDGRRVTELLLVPPRNPRRETWEGRRFGAERAARTLGVEMAVDNTRFEEILGPVLTDPARRTFHLPLPAGVAEGSELDGQLRFFIETARPITAPDGGPAGTLLSAISIEHEDGDFFRRIQQYLAGNLDPEELRDPLLREAHAAFTGAASPEAWNRWKQEHLAAVPDVFTLRGVLDSLRTVKTDEEIRLMRRAVDISVAAHRELMRSLEPGMTEYQAEALIEYVFARNGASGPGYPSIVGSGENSTILHYSTNRRPMQAGDLVVIDAGAEYHGYTADVTRTLPVGGRFTPEQRRIYDLVLEAQEAAIRAARAGEPFQAPHRAAMEIVARGLKELGLIREESEARRFFNHGTSHWLGLDVHDVSGSNVLLPGSIITVEPGVYIPAGEDVDPKWWNIGVRIEDDVLITADGPVNLSAAAPRTAADVEALMRETGLGNDQAGVVK